jgi:hypothetical protein
MGRGGGLRSEWSVGDSKIDFGLDAMNNPRKSISGNSVRVQVACRLLCRSSFAGFLSG